MRILLLLPELEEGGVERHVVELAAGLSARGHVVGVVSCGGPLEKLLPEGVRRIRLPLSAKNPFSGAYAAVRLALSVRRDGWELLHAHSRVPAWIAWWTSALCGVPWIVTCHARYSRNAGLHPYRFARAAICVTESVRTHLADVLPQRVAVIPNGLPEPSCVWCGAAGTHRLLFIGRLTRVKGADFLFDVLSRTTDLPWTLDVLGEGSLLGELRDRVAAEGWGERVFLRGFRSDVDAFLSNCSCLLVPSRDEGMGMVFANAVRMGVPVLASRLPALEESASGEGFLPVGDVAVWAAKLRDCLVGAELFPHMELRIDLSLARWLDATEAFCKSS